MALGKRYEVYFPLESNPDQNGERRPIEKEKLAQTYLREVERVLVIVLPNFKTIFGAK